MKTSYIPTPLWLPRSALKRVSIRALPLLLLAGANACGDSIVIDDFGPPAGFGAVAGLIQNAAGTPQVGMGVAISRCSAPVGGFFGDSSSDASGRYRVDGALAPGFRGVLDVDTVRVSCELFVGPRGTPLVTDTVTIRFATVHSAVVPTIRDVTIP